MMAGCGRRPRRHKCIDCRDASGAPTYRFDVLKHMAKMDRTIGIGQALGDEDLAWFDMGLGYLMKRRSATIKRREIYFTPVTLFRNLPYFESMPFGWNG